MSSATMKMVTINITVPGSEDQPPNPSQNLDPGEFIVKRIVALDELSSTLKG